MRLRIPAVFTALVITIAACGSDDSADEPTTTEPPSAPQTVDTDTPEGASAASTPGSDAEPPANADPDGVARIGYDLVKSSSGGFSFDPAANRTPTPDLGLLHWVFGGLMRQTPEGELEPDLAESATVIDDTTIEVVLREGITFADGTAVDAEQVQAAIERNLADPTLPAFQSDFFSLESIEIVSPDTLRFNIPDGTAESWLDRFIAGVETVIIPENVDFAAPAGAGPFQVTEFQPEQRIELTKNPDYWAAGEIDLAGIEIIHVQGSTDAASALRAGQIDFARLDYATTDSVGDNELVIETNPNHITLFYVCKATEPFDDPQVRQALNYAIDREAIAEALFDGNAAPAWDFWPEGHPLHNPELTGYYSHDPDKARELLTEAGHPEGVTVGVIPASSTAFLPEIVQIVQQQWAEAGITMNIVQSNNVVTDYFENRETPLFLTGVGATPGRAKLGIYSGPSLSNACGYEDPELDALIEDLGHVSDRSPEAADIWAAIQEIIVTDALGIHLVFQPTVDAYNSDRLGGMALIPYTFRVPDVHQLHVMS